jgi:hypothetical protein
MSFLKKFTKELDGLKSSFGKSDENKEQKHGGKMNPKAFAARARTDLSL